VYQFSLHEREFPDHWRNLAELWHVTSGAKKRLEWLIFYYTLGKRNARKTAGYFGIAPKTVHKWKKRFDPKRIQSLEECSRAPFKRREWQVTASEERRIISLRNHHLEYGKKKLQVCYLREYHQSISTWKIERVIRKHHLYPDPVQMKRKKRHPRRPYRRIGELRHGYTGTLWHTDSITIWWYGQRRVIFTALEDKTKLGYARVYLNSTSRKAKDFLTRLVYLSSGDITIIHSDNGSEFAGEFAGACRDLGIEQVFSRPRQPKDNPALERFNRTVQDEWLSLSDVGLDEVDEANIDLTEWLIEYNNYRPHETLDYLTPLEYAYKTKVLPKTPASTLI
jgi:transposase InsO family protein